MECKFVVGQRVVCIDGANTSFIREDELENGKVYEVSWIGMYEHPMSGIAGVPYPGLRPCIKVQGVRRDSGVPFAAARFRPVEKSTQKGMEALRKLQNLDKDTIKDPGKVLEDVS